MVEREALDGFEIFLARLMERIKRELATEKDPSRGLRRALLGLIVANGEMERRATKRYVNFLLEEFRPLADHFEEETHALLDAFDVRRHSDGENAELLFPNGLSQAIMDEPLSADDLGLAGLQWPWEITADRYVGFFDIMGFKALVERFADNHEELHEILSVVRGAALSAEEMDFDVKTPEGPLNFKGKWLRFAQFSDSIVIISRDTSPLSSATMSLAAQVMFGRALAIGIPIRGAIAKGLFTADFQRSIFFGKPLIDAYLLEGKQAWYGVCYHPTATDGGDDPATGEAVEGGAAPKGWLPTAGWYPVPVKTSGGYAHEEMSALNWAMFYKGRPEELDAAIAPMGNEGDPKLSRYFEETRRFGHAMLAMMEEEDE